VPRSVNPGTAVCYAPPKDIEWETPESFFRRLDDEFSFTLDVAASEGNAKCERFFTWREDGLHQDWASEVCWMNPPYGRAISLWMGRAVAAARAGATVVCLVPARTDARWWHDYALLGEIRFVKGRIRFGGGNKSNPLSHNAPFPCAVVVLRPGLPDANGHLTMEAA
jgi:phage N-6-adenine-methyltransferase